MAIVQKGRDSNLLQDVSLCDNREKLRRVALEGGRSLNIVHLPFVNHRNDSLL